MFGQCHPIFRDAHLLAVSWISECEDCVLWVSLGTCTHLEETKIQWKRNEGAAGMIFIPV